MRLEAGDAALLIDSKGRRFLLELTPDRTFQYHEGAVPHNDLIGRDDGSWIVSSTGAQLLLLRPRLADFTLKMKRSAQVVYPKDLGPILVYADIAPGMTGQQICRLCRGRGIRPCRRARACASPAPRSRSCRAR